MVNNELRLAAASFHDAMKAVSAATDRLAAAVGAEADTPNPHERTREERNFLLQLRSGFVRADCLRSSLPRAWSPKSKE